MQNLSSKIVLVWGKSSVIQVTYFQNIIPALSCHWHGPYRMLSFFHPILINQVQRDSLRFTPPPPGEGGQTPMVAFENRLSYQVFLLLSRSLLHFLSTSQFLPVLISDVFAPLYLHLANRLWHAMAQLILKESIPINVTAVQPSHSLSFSDFQRQADRQAGRQRRERKILLPW